MKIDEELIARDMERWKEDMRKRGLRISKADIEEHVAEINKAINSEPAPCFKGFTSWQIHLMLNFPLEEGCPVQLRILTEEEITQIPIMRQVVYLLKALEEKDLKLTSKGNLPIKMVEDLYQLGSHSMETDHYDQKTEDRCKEVQVVHAALEQTALIKKNQGKLSLTAKGRKLLENPNELLREVITFLFCDYHTGYLDDYYEFESGNIGRLYSLWLLHHYGAKWRKLRDYEKDYFIAFPFIECREVYSFRTFDNLFRIIGLCQIKESNNKDQDEWKYWNDQVRKTPVLDMMFSFEEPSMNKWI